MLPQPHTSRLPARVVYFGRRAAYCGLSTCLLLAVALTVLPAAAQSDLSENHAALKWMPRRPIAETPQQPVQTQPRPTMQRRPAQTVVQTQAIEDTEPTVAPPPQAMSPRVSVPARRVSTQVVAQPQARAMGAAQAPAKAPAQAAAGAQAPAQVQSGAPLVRNGGVVMQSDPMDYAEGPVYEDGGMMGCAPGWDAGDSWGSCNGCCRGQAFGGGLMRWMTTSHPMWARTEMMIFWSKGMHTPPLVTTSPDGTARTDAGVLGRDSTSVLFGASNLADSSRLGGRFTLGRWFDPCETTGIEVSYLATEADTTGYFATSTGSPILARPFYNIQTGEQDAKLVAYPQVSNGSIDVYAKTRLWGLDAVMRHELYSDPTHRLDLITGYRYMDLRDEFRTHEFTFSTDPTGTVPLGSSISIIDSFNTRNDFHGANLGFAGRMQNARWSMDMLMKLGVGNTRSRVALDGSTQTISPPGATPVVADSGLLVLPSNQGTVSHNHFSMLPELGLNLGYDLTPRMRATVGYSLIYWSHVARAADQVNTDLNTSQASGGTLAGAALPRQPFVVDDYWIQGINFGLDLRF
jgi:hypothetical protein